MIRRNKPLKRSSKPIRKRRKAKEFSTQHFDLILDGAVRKYKNGREVCQDNVRGKVEYRRRVEEMSLRQRHFCCLCGFRMFYGYATFEHTSPRKMGSSERDDRILDENGQPMNGAAHAHCNAEKGSRRLKGAE